MKLEEIASKVNRLDLTAFLAHREAAGHRSREICDSCPQPITRMIVRYGETYWSVKPRKKRGSFN